MTKTQILEALLSMQKENLESSKISAPAVSLTDYSSLVRVADDGSKIWTDAFQQAVNENCHVLIPKCTEPYYIDKTVIIPSDRCIEAEDGAVIRLMPGTKTLLMRNEHNEDGTHKKETFENPDTNIHISGGLWEESRTEAGGYGISGKYDEARSYYGVSTCMFFNNVKGLTLENMTFSHAGGFSIQLGNLKNAVVRNIEFIGCFRDGVHVNGNTENIFIKDIRGQVGDDLVAFNMYDWQNSSVDFGPIRTAWCENVVSDSKSHYKSFRILPGTYRYDDGTTVDCSIKDAVIKNISGIKTVKMYFQTPRYELDARREAGDTGSADNLYFENIQIDLTEPVDKLKPYMESDPVTGSIAGFEIGANIGNVYFENVDVTLYREKFPMSYFICVGPKSVRLGNLELFDPEISCHVENIHLKNVSVNGGNTEDAKNYIREIAFNDIYGDNRAIGKGTVGGIVCDGEQKSLFGIQKKTATL